MFLEAAIALLALLTAIFMHPWRLLGNQRPLVHEAHGRPSALWTPLLATLVILPWAWALPTLHHMPLQLQWSGACLVLLTLGWPLAIPVLLAVGVIAALVSPGLSWGDALGLAVWHPALADLDMAGAIEAFREHLGGRLHLSMLTGLGQRIEIHAVDLPQLEAARAELAGRGEGMPPAARRGAASPGPLRRGA